MANTQTETKKIINTYYDKKIQQLDDKMGKILEKHISEEEGRVARSKEYTDLVRALNKYKDEVEFSCSFIEPNYHIQSLINDLQNNRATTAKYSKYSRSGFPKFEEFEKIREQQKELGNLRRKDLFILENYRKTDAEYKELLKRISEYIKEV